MYYRLFLLFLLPLTALFIYFDGQNYDPDLLDFQPGINSNPLIISFLPNKIDIFQRVGQVRQYFKDNLYEHINGHAEFFISYGFLKLAVAEYSSYNSEENNPEFTVDIYDMGKFENAFGVLMEESGKNSTPIKIGSRGFKTQRSLNFFKGPYYIKMSSFNDKTPIDTFAQKLNILIKVQERSIPQFEKFPQEGVVINSGKFIKENYHGLAFVNNVFEQKYEINDAKYSAFLIEGRNEDTANLLKKYFKFFEGDDIKYETLQYKNWTYYKVLDPFEGDWFLIPSSQDIFGIYGAITNEPLLRFLESINS